MATLEPSVLRKSATAIGALNMISESRNIKAVYYDQSGLIQCVNEFIKSVDGFMEHQNLIDYHKVKHNKQSLLKYIDNLSKTNVNRAIDSSVLTQIGPQITDEKRIRSDRYPSDNEQLTSQLKPHNKSPDSSLEAQKQLTQSQERVNQLKLQNGQLRDQVSKLTEDLEQTIMTLNEILQPTEELSLKETLTQIKQLFDYHSRMITSNDLLEKDFRAKLKVIDQHLEKLSSENQQLNIDKKHLEEYQQTLYQTIQQLKLKNAKQEKFYSQQLEQREQIIDKRKSEVTDPDYLSLVSQVDDLRVENSRVMNELISLKSKIQQLESSSPKG